MSRKDNFNLSVGPSHHVTSIPSVLAAYPVHLHAEVVSIGRGGSGGRYTIALNSSGSEASHVTPTDDLNRKRDAAVPRPCLS